jgi:hypothetical protein
MGRLGRNEKLAFFGIHRRIVDFVNNPLWDYLIN